MYQFNGFHIPERMMGGITRYIEHGIRPGDFLVAIICNDLREAVARADTENMANIPAFVSFFYNEAPRDCWGSPEKMDAWLARCGDSAPAGRADDRCEICGHPTPCHCQEPNVGEA